MPPVKIGLVGLGPVGRSQWHWQHCLVMSRICACICCHPFLPVSRLSLYSQSVLTFIWTLCLTEGTEDKPGWQKSQSPEHWLKKITNTERSHMQTNATHQSSLVPAPHSSSGHWILYLFILRPQRTEKPHPTCRSLRGGKTGSGRLASRNITQSQPQTNSSVSNPCPGWYNIICRYRLADHPDF